MTNKIALIDMDDVLTDYDQGMRESMKALDPTLSDDDSNYHGDELSDCMFFRRKTIWNMPGWWGDLESRPAGIYIEHYLRTALGYSTYVLSKGPPGAPGGWSEKIVWCNNYVPSVTGVLITNGDKSVVYGNILVDDNINNVKKWLDMWPLSIALIPRYNWNQGFEHQHARYYCPEATCDEIEEIVNWADYKVRQFYLG